MCTLRETILIQWLILTVLQQYLFRAAPYRNHKNEQIYNFGTLLALIIDI
jgi:hypothetical protein